MDGVDHLKDVVGIGNPVVDILAASDDDFLSKSRLVKGGMRMVDAQWAATIYQSMYQPLEMSGGSVGNTMAGLAHLGGTGSYVGKVCNDRLGRIFQSDMESLGVTFVTKPDPSSSPTASCLIIVTPDGERSMATYLGACFELTVEEIDAQSIQSHQVTYIEGYLWDALHARPAMTKAARLAHEAGRKVAFTLSDSSCVDRHRMAFRDFIVDQIDILLCNEDEILALYPENSFHAAFENARSSCELVAVTRGAAGSVIAFQGSTYEVEPVPVCRVVDTTGAGDLFAAGLLFGFTHGYDIPVSGRIGSILSGEIIGHFGGRPLGNVRELVKDVL